LDSHFIKINNQFSFHPLDIWFQAWNDIVRVDSRNSNKRVFSNNPFDFTSLVATTQTKRFDPAAHDWGNNFLVKWLTSPSAIDSWRTKSDNTSKPWSRDENLQDFCFRPLPSLWWCE
jgi:hypothetical protein